MNQPTWREIVDHHHTRLVDELSTCLDSDLRHAIAQAVAAERRRAEDQLALACEQTRRAQVESLNQSLRRLRQAAPEQNVFDILSESCAAHTESVVVLVFENSHAHFTAGRGVDAAGLSFEIAAAPAVVSAVETRDPVVAFASDAELSPDLARTLAPDGVADPDRKAYLFPLVARHSVVAMLVASGAKPLSTAPVELLCEVAGMRLEALLRAPEPQAKASGLVQLGPLPSNGAASERLTWDTLSPEDQKLHLQAQRMARVRVAEMRLNHANELREGGAASDIYGALQPSIDKARDQFLQNFLAKSDTMVDYLHLEILSSLAHDDDRLLGPNYPGPMV